MRLAVLRTLDENKYSIFRNVYLGYGGTDHVVLGGPMGIFAIETRFNHGRVTVEQRSLKIVVKDGSKTDYERKAAQESYQLKVVFSERLDVKKVRRKGADYA